MKQLLVHPSAAMEAEEAAVYYADRSSEVAQEFVVALERCIRLVIESPRTWPKISDSVHRRQVEGFPHWVVYETRGDTVRILAIAHPSRQQGYWQERE